MSFSTGGSPPFDPDSETPTNTNEPYLDWINSVLAQSSIPPVITTSYGDDEQTVSPYHYAAEPSPLRRLNTLRYPKIMQLVCATYLPSLAVEVSLPFSQAATLG